MSFTIYPPHYITLQCALSRILILCQLPKTCFFFCPSVTLSVMKTLSYWSNALAKWWPLGLRSLKRLRKVTENVNLIIFWMFSWFAYDLPDCAVQRFKMAFRYLCTLPEKATLIPLIEKKANARAFCFWKKIKGQINSWIEIWWYYSTFRQWEDCCVRGWLLGSLDGQSCFPQPFPLTYYIQCNKNLLSYALLDFDLLVDWL